MTFSMEMHNVFLSPCLLAFFLFTTNRNLFLTCILYFFVVSKSNLNTYHYQ
jgi:hypothetical protein